MASWETRILTVLRQRVTEESETLDVKYQAALALGDFQQQWAAAAELLNSLLTLRADWLRKGAVDALCAIARPEIRSPLYKALSDADAEIRFRAATGLKKALGSAQAVGFIIDRILQEDIPPSYYLDAPAPDRRPGCLGCPHQPAAQP
jgi:HEAT repeat protein